MNGVEYIIVNKIAIQKRIKELEKSQKENPFTEAIWAFAKEELQKILFQSTPLIPEIEKAFDAGSERDEYGYGNANNKSDYISNLKLDL